MWKGQVKATVQLNDQCERYLRVKLNIINNISILSIMCIRNILFDVAALFEIEMFC